MILKIATILVTIGVASLFTSAARADLRLDCPEAIPKTLSFLKPAPATDPCAGYGTALVALMSTRILSTCENDKTIASYDVSIGRRGTGKFQTGDLKTPLGTYALGSPRPSEQFGIFIPVGYPTSIQRAQGLTGDDVGIHGPGRFFACAGAMNVSMNWTQGCLAVADDHFIVAIASFVKSHPSAPLHVLR